MTIKRFLSDEFLNNFVQEFNNLLKIVRNSKGELDLSIRDDYLNLYYKGNSLARIAPSEPSGYKVSIHQKFFTDTKADSDEFYEIKRMSGNYVEVSLNSKEHPRRFLQKQHIDEFCRRVKQVNYGEEIVFEQALITDNLGRQDLIIIDRQITDTGLKRKRLDLLALEQLESDKNQYGFLVIEVKLGNNPELKNDVALQLEGYVNHIRKHFEDYQICYQNQYVQKRLMGIINPNFFENISIVDQVRGLVVVGGYSKMAKQNIWELGKNNPEIDVKQFDYRL